MSAAETFVADVTQYLRPNGRRVLQHTKLPKKVEAFYKDMVEHKAELTAEVLTTNQISLTVTGPMPKQPEMEDDLDIEIVSNGPWVIDAIIRMLKRQKWRHAPL